jgi:hypothetical protein
MEAESFSETLVMIYHTMWHNIPEKTKPHEVWVEVEV